MTPSDLKQLHRILTIARNTLILPAIILATLSLSTLFWSKTTGTMHSSMSARVTTAGDAVAHGYHGRYGGSFHLDVAKYSYTVEDNNYSSGLVCICLPIGLQLPEAGAKVAVYYVPMLPSVSVLRRTPDFWLIGLLLFLGVGANVAAQRLSSLKPEP